ncbi:hypothetical protein BU198_08275 [Streptomyces sp. CBMA156]|nr:hypothetical protein [Streptomyces sp. CBMA156]
MLPGIQRAAGLSVAELQQIATDRPGPGQTKLVPGRSEGAALARIALKGEGDLVLMLYQDGTGTELDRALAGEPLRKATEAPAGRLR